MSKKPHDHLRRIGRILSWLGKYDTAKSIEAVAKWSKAHDCQNWYDVAETLAMPTVPRHVPSDSDVVVVAPQAEEHPRTCKTCYRVGVYSHGKLFLQSLHRFPDAAAANAHADAVAKLLADPPRRVAVHDLVDTPPATG